MGLTPLSRSLGTNTTASKDTADTTAFHPVQLSSSYVLSGGSPSGVIFKGISTNAKPGAPASGMGNATLRTTQHQAIAGMTNDGTMLFAVNSRVSGRNCTAIGGYDAKGEPLVPTAAQQAMLAGLFRDPGALLVPTAAKPSTIGVKTEGINPNYDASFNMAKKQFTFGFKSISHNNQYKVSGSATVDGKMKLVNASMEASKADDRWKASLSTDRAPNQTSYQVAGEKGFEWGKATGSYKTTDGRTTGSALGLSGKRGETEVAANWQKNATEVSRKLSVTHGAVTGSALYKTNGGESAREFQIDYKKDQFSISVFAKPDLTAPAAQPTPKPGTDVDWKAFSKYGIELKITF